MATITSILPQEIFTDRIFPLLPTGAKYRFSQVSKAAHEIVRTAAKAPQEDITLEGKRVIVVPASVPSFLRQGVRIEILTNHPELLVDIATVKNTIYLRGCDPDDITNLVEQTCYRYRFLELHQVESISFKPGLIRLLFIYGTMFNLPRPIIIDKILPCLTARETQNFNLVSKCANALLQGAAWMPQKDIVRNIPPGAYVSRRARYAVPKTVPALLRQKREVEIFAEETAKARLTDQAPPKDEAASSE
jgi:hypothetical protein